MLKYKRFKSSEELCEWANYTGCIVISITENSEGNWDQITLYYRDGQEL